MKEGIPKYKPYPVYKHSGLKWIGHIPDAWEIRKLKHMGRVRSSSIDKKDDYEIKLRVVNYNDVVKNPTINQQTKLEFTSCSQNQFAAFKLREGDLVITKDSMDISNIADTSLIEDVTEDTVCGYHLYIFSRINNFVNSKYFYYSFNNSNLKKFLLVLSKGTTIIGLSSVSLSNSIFPLPSLLEQQAIVDFLDRETGRINTIIEKQNRLTELLKEKRSALITKAVTKGLDPNAKMKPSGVEWIGEIPEGWEVRKLKFVSKVVLGKMIDTTPQQGLTLKPYLKSRNIEWEMVNVEDVDEMYFTEGDLEHYSVKKNDLLVSEGGEVGKTCIWKNELPECYIQNSVHKITVNEKDLTPKYLLMLFVAYGSGKVFQNIVNQVSIAHLTKDKLTVVRIPLPSIPKQKNIVAFLDRETDKIDVLVSKIQKQIDLLNEYKQSLITAAVTGKIDVRDIAYATNP